MYWGESSRSSRQRTLEHLSAIEGGLTHSPMVEHTVRQHGGLKPETAFMIQSIEPRALYRAVKESVAIANMGQGPNSMN